MSRTQQSTKSSRIVRHRHRQPRERVPHLASGREPAAYARLKFRLKTSRAYVEAHLRYGMDRCMHGNCHARLPAAQAYAEATVRSIMLVNWRARGRVDSAFRDGGEVQLHASRTRRLRPAGEWIFLAAV
ncbi:hypothetical protein L226DRAFT_94178 [Lentinus tigrinus ALCF2SS1-7]|uniref:uncharacterized protein n=1 Tax=Lentinus tigrinus ALCF2SS1-7 TaxID=1328758 RepID=UPI001165FEDD|nr:hypothetical protein L226DRAFT_94178 [Lentinus tigrinus ALCF2SS1-7]